VVEEVAPGVFAVDQSIVEGKNGVVVGRRAALAIDTGNSDDDARGLVEVLREQGHGPARLVLTHGHGDHILGGGLFRGAEVFAHERCASVMARHLPALAERYGRPGLADELAWPTVAFAGELRIDLGGKTAHLFPAPGHSPDGIAVYVPEAGVLFGADTAVTGIVPAINDGDSAVLVDSLRRLIDVGAEVLVPGHGPVVRGRAEVRAALAWSLGYLEGLRDHLRARPDPDAADYDRFVGDRFPEERHGMAKRHRDVATKIVQELAR
jgi:glyoxylase-like metal-dependent hydrolase (beta-lactamase superfamily II)